jgi:outer membrane protein assembly factor BamB
VANVQIDLGEVREHRESAAATPISRPPVPYRALLAALSVVLVGLLGGAQHVGPPQLPTVIPARLGDATFVIDDRLFLVGTGRLETGEAVTDRVIGTYALPDGELLGRTTVALPGSVMQVTQARDTMLVAYQLNTSGTQAVVAMAAGTDRQLWQRTARLVAASPADGVALLSDDHAHYAVDLATGALRWSVPRPADGFITEAGPDGPYPRWLVLVTDSGRLETRDAHTGRVIAAATVSELPGRANGLIWPTGRLMLVDTGAGFDGYRLPDLTRQWHTTVDLSESWMQADCGLAICTYRQQRGMTALDPATGREMWHSDRWAYAEPADRYLLATANDGEDDVPKLWVLDSATGRALGNFGDWEGLGPAGEGRVYGKRDIRGQYTVWYGVLDPATRHVRILGAGHRISGGCETAAAVLICRLVDASVAIWRLG